MKPRKRASGVLLHLTCLPGPHGSGDLGADARKFVDWLVEANQQLWQILPLTSPGLGNSPYSSPSAFAGNPLLIDLDALDTGSRDEPTLPGGSEGHIDFDTTRAYRMQRLRRAWERLRHDMTQEEREAFAAFRREEAWWLDDYALFMSLDEHHRAASWLDWPSALARREPTALAAAREEHAEGMLFWQFCQWIFKRQWLDLKACANARDIRIIGDMPIFVSHHSADVWAHPELFKLDDHGRCCAVSGVPPDDFSEDGQLWSNPVYRWEAHERTGFDWWIRRFGAIQALVDIVRLDHFRGFVSYWEIPAGENTGRNGKWMPAPGNALFEALKAALGEVRAIAEDPGTFIAEVDGLRQKFSLPGMRILQFAFNGDDNLFLPHKHEHEAVVYTGTHDNNTTLGWWADADESERDYARRYLDTPATDISDDLLRAACASVADTAIHPLQDVLGLGAEARMNRPGRSEGNWSWRFTWDQLTPAHTTRLAELTSLYQRGREAKPQG